MNSLIFSGDLAESSVIFNLGTVLFQPRILVKFQVNVCCDLSDPLALCSPFFFGLQTIPSPLALVVPHSRWILVLSLLNSLLVKWMKIVSNCMRTGHHYQHIVWLSGASLIQDHNFQAKKWTKGTRLHVDPHEVPYVPICPGTAMGSWFEFQA